MVLFDAPEWMRQPRAILIQVVTVQRLGREVRTGMANIVNLPGRSRSSSGDRMATQAGARKVSTTASFSGSSVTVQK
jgi:hypothetical protein